MAVTYTIPCILRPLGQTGVLWGPSEITLGPMGTFCGVILRGAALGTQYECLVWSLLLHDTREVYREFALPFWNARRI